MKYGKKPKMKGKYPPTSKFLETKYEKKKKEEEEEYYRSGSVV
jgi:hypothetical protein